MFIFYALHIVSLNVQLKLFKFPVCLKGIIWITLLCLVSGNFGSQPEPSLVLSQLTHGQQDVGTCTKPSALAQLASPSIHVVPSTLESSKPRDSEGSSSSGRIDPFTSSVLESQVCSTQQRQSKIQKRKIPPASKVPICHS